MLVLFVCCLVAGVIGVGLVVFEIQSWHDRLSFLLIGAGVVGAPSCVVFLKQASPAKASRISRFAGDNGFEFEALKDSAGYQGSNFKIGDAQRRLLVVTGKIDGHRVEFGNLSFRFEGRRSPWAVPGYVAIRLPERLPHIIVRSSRRSLSRVTYSPSAQDQVEVPGGDALRVYAPAGAEQAVGALFTTQVSELFSRLSHRYGIEIVGDVLFLYSRWPVSTGSGRTWGRILADVADVCELIGASRVWDLMRTRRRSYLKGLPEIRNDFDEARVKKITWWSFGAFMVITTVLVAWFHNW